MVIKKAAAIGIVFSLFVTSACTAGTYVQAGTADSGITLASLEYSFSNAAVDAETDGALSKTKYGEKEKGYKLDGIVKGALLFASVNGTDKRKLEWSSESNVYQDSAAGRRPLRQPVMTAGRKNPWKAGTRPYFEIQIPTSGYQNISFSAYIGATKKGPKNYQLSYAVGNSTAFTSVSGASLALNENKVMSKLSAVLPAAADNQEMLKIRIEITSLSSVHGDDMTTAQNCTSGEAAINHIRLSGTKLPPDTASQGMTVKGITLNKQAAKLKKNQSLSLKAGIQVTPQTTANVNAVQSKLKWASSNKKVAAVSKSGKVTAKKKGNATITVTYSKEIKASCKIKVQ